MTRAIAITATLSVLITAVFLSGGNTQAKGLLSALSSAKGGDTIELASGNYGSVDMNNLSFSSYVTITSADGDQGAVFTDIGFHNSSHIRVDGVHVANPGNGSSGSKLVSITESDHISVQNSEIHGKIDGTYDGHFGIYVDDGTKDIHLADNDIHDVKIGIAVYQADGLEVSGNVVDDTGSDGYKFSNIKNYLVENNSHGGNFYAAPGAHIDFMQFEGTAGTSNGVIRGNVFLIGNKPGIQGIFMNAAPHDNVLIEQNIIYTSHLNALKLNKSSTNVTIQDNTVLHAPTDYSHSYSPIIAGSGATRLNNIWTGLNGDMSGSNIVVQYDNPSDENYYGDLFANADVGYGVTLEDLLAISGSVADGKGAYERLRILLGR